MRVYMLAYTYYETDNRVKQYAETLAKRGDHVDVIALRHKGRAYHKNVLLKPNVKALAQKLKARLNETKSYDKDSCRV